MQNIAIISDHASPLAELGSVDAGGQNVYVAQIAAELGRRGCAVDVFTRRDAPSLPPVVQWQPNVRVVHVKAGPERFVPKEHLLPHMSEFARNVEAHCRDSARRYDIVHANFFMSGVVALRLKQRMAMPFAVTFHALGLVRRRHQGSDDGFDDRRFAIEARLMAQADAIVAECEQDEIDMIDLYGAPHDRIDCVPCGFDPAEFSHDPKARSSLGLDRGEFVVLQLGRMVARKGVDNVIRGVAALSHHYGVDARLMVVGGDGPTPDPVRTPELGRLMEVARREGIADRVVFSGSRPRRSLRTYYSAADVFVTTPWYEPFGITPLEAMACGRPVVGSAVGGLKSTIVDGRTGYLVPARDPEALAERLASLARSPGLARRMGRAGRRRVVQRYTWQRVVDELVVVYERALRRNGPEPWLRSVSSVAASRHPVGILAENAGA